MKKEEIIEDIRLTLAENLPDVSLFDVEFTGGQGNRVLKVFIEHPEGVNHDLCARVTGLLGRYRQDHAVEVSSPGVERNLRRPEHFRSVVGKKIKVKTYGPVQGVRDFTGFLILAEGDRLLLDLEGKEVSIPLDDVAKAYTVFDFGRQ